MLGHEITHVALALEGQGAGCIAPGAADRQHLAVHPDEPGLPVVVFFLAQRAFMRGVVVTGVEK